MANHGVKGNRTAVFRCDATTRIGGGHVFRSMALADELERAGWNIAFAVGSATTATVPALAARGWRVERGFDVENDEGPRLLALWPGGVPLLVLDHYERDVQLERTARGWAERLTVIDDLANRAHDCDILVDQTFGRSERDYVPLVPTNAMILTGSQFAILRPEFARNRVRALKRRGQVDDVHRLLISFGATDPDGFALQAVRAIRESPRTFETDVVIGHSATTLQILKDIAARDPYLRVHVDTPAMAELMCAADLAIGAAGSSAWERCCLGLPTVMVVLADNQRLVARSLSDAGAAAVLEPNAELPARLRDQIERLASSGELRRDMSRRAAAVVDGEGASRVVAHIEGLFSN